MGVKDFNIETPEDKARRKQRAHELTNGPRGLDGRTAAERALLAKLWAMNYECRRSWLVNNEGIYEHERVVVRRIN